MEIGFGWSEAIAAAALVVAIVGWIDSRRRLAQTEVAFAVERTSDPGRYLIRSTGTRTVRRARIATERLAVYEIDGLTWMPVMRPGDSLTFWLRSSRGEIPEEIEMRFGRRGERVIAFPQSAS